MYPIVDLERYDLIKSLLHEALNVFHVLFGMFDFDFEVGEDLLHDL